MVVYTFIFGLLDAGPSYTEAVAADNKLREVYMRWRLLICATPAVCLLCVLAELVGTLRSALRIFVRWFFPGLGSGRRPRRPPRIYSFPPIPPPSSGGGTEVAEPGGLGRRRDARELSSPPARGRPRRVRLHRHVPARDSAWRRFGPVGPRAVRHGRHGVCGHAWRHGSPVSRRSWQARAGRGSCARGRMGACARSGPGACRGAPRRGHGVLESLLHRVPEIPEELHAVVLVVRGRHELGDEE